MAEPSVVGGPEEALVAAAIGSMAVAVVILDRDGRVVRANPVAARQLGAGFLAAPLDRWAESWGQAAGSPAARALAGETSRAELVCQAGPLAGTRFAITASPISAGAARGAVLTFADIGGDHRGEVTAAVARPPATGEVVARTGVLLVEADDDAREQTARLLRDAGFAVAEAGSARDALRAAVATAGPLDVLLTDLILDDETGSELAHQLLRIRPRLSIFYMSDHPWGALVPANATGRGPVFLRKPLEPAALVEAIARAAGGDTAEAAAPAPGRVLVVDDDDDMRQGVASLLRDEGLEVLEAREGRAALDLAEASELDVVVSDINMPCMTGIDLLKEIRSRDIDVPVILLTAAPRVDSASTAVQYGAYRYLSKPVDAQELVDAVQLAIRSGRLARLRRDAQGMAGIDEAWRPSDGAGLDVRLDSALHDLWLEYQPLVRAAGHQISAFEALVRTGEPSLRRPLQLFAAADQQGRTGEVGRDIRRIAAHDLAGAPPDVDLHLNINATDLEDPDLYAPDAPLSRVARRVVLEISERQPVALDGSFEGHVRDLRAMGYRFALDDLGTGPSGLATFSMLAPDMVKLDPSLVRGIHATPAKRKTIADMIALCRDMNVEVIAEGIELEEESACLAELGCDRLQGHLFARPSRDFRVAL
jgi:EAL domain-containing protein (putative c-di-GMP-specific phosphodiesterase class I)/FixJ family two-component response regulator